MLTAVFVYFLDKRLNTPEAIVYLVSYGNKGKTLCNTLRDRVKCNMSAQIPPRHAYCLLYKEEDYLSSKLDKNKCNEF